MIIHGWKFVKKKSGLFKKRPKEKNLKKMVLNKSKKKKKERKKRSRSAI